MKCQILFSKNNMKMFKMFAETKFNIWCIFPRKQKPVFSGKISNSSSPAKLAQRVKKVKVHC